MVKHCTVCYFILLQAMEVIERTFFSLQLQELPLGWDDAAQELLMSLPLSCMQPHHELRSLLA